MIYEGYRYRMIDPGITSNYYEIRRISDNYFVGVLKEEDMKIYKNGIIIDNIPNIDIIIMKLYEYYS